MKIVLSKFLPAIFMDAMRDSAEASVHMFEGELFCHGTFKSAIEGHANESIGNTIRLICCYCCCCSMKLNQKLYSSVRPYSLREHVPY